MGVGRFWRGFGIPLAEARLLAIDEDISRALDLATLDSLGGPIAVSGDVDLASCCPPASAAVAASEAAFVAARGSTSSFIRFSCLVLMI